MIFLLTFREPPPLALRETVWENNRRKEHARQKEIAERISSRFSHRPFKEFAQDPIPSQTFFKTSCNVDFIAVLRMLLLSRTPFVFLIEFSPSD